MPIPAEMAIAARLRPSEWLYTRNDESVRVSVQQDSGVWVTYIDGPGNSSRLRLFHEENAFELFRAHHAQELANHGFQLSVVAERRGEAAAKKPAPVLQHERRRPRSIRRSPI